MSLHPSRRNLGDARKRAWNLSIWLCNKKGPSINCIACPSVTCDKERKRQKAQKPRSCNSVTSLLIICLPDNHLQPSPWRKRPMQPGPAHLPRTARESLARFVPEVDVSLASNAARNVTKTFVSVTTAQCRAIDVLIEASTASSATMPHLNAPQANSELRPIRLLRPRLLAPPRPTLVPFVVQVPLPLDITPNCRLPPPLRLYR